MKTFNKKLGVNLDDQIERVFYKNKVSSILIDGGLGEGKTTIAFHIADYINVKRGFKPLEINRDNPQYAYGIADFVNKLVKCYELGLPVIIFDEAGEFASRSALSRANREINRVFETYRAFKIIVVICLPHFNSLDSSIFRNEIVRLLIHLHSRTQTYGNYRGYGCIAIDYMRGLIKKGCNPRAVYKYANPNFRGHFWDLDKERSRLLDKVGRSLKSKGAKQAGLKLDGLLSIKEIAIKTGKSPLWVSRVIKRLNIKPVRLVGKAQYFNEAITEALYNVM